jgi:acyl-CoA reductase-like NAD-dependent aldehyde dehydrogenase
MLEVRSPATGELVGSVPDLDAAGVSALVARARAAQPSWQAVSLRARARLLLRYRELLVDRAEEVAELSSRETGKLVPEALLTDVLGTAGVAQWSARRAVAVLGRQRVPSGFLVTKRSYIVREPYGVVGIISPWNWPVLNAMRAVLPAIMAGNAVVLKPSEASPFSALLQKQLADEAGCRRRLPRRNRRGGAGAALVAGPSTRSSSPAAWRRDVALRSPPRSDCCP